MIEAGFDVDSRQLLMDETEAYGLTFGPSGLRQSSVADLENMGHIRNPYDRCIMTLPSSSSSKINDG
eukprot:9443116-Karenia_brevis.AAC.1